ncbi:MAG: CusA/CzcA family heavy metal efflux RND transporter [Candidatus Riflemargulisbacteria bacterium]
MNIIDKIIESSAKHRILVVSFVLLGLLGAFFAIKNIPLDAIPDLSDTQVIVYAKWDRPPQQIEDQVTYPVVTALLGIPHAKDIRAFSDYGFSYIYVIFDEGTDIYWARSRVLEYLAKVNSQLPSDVKIDLGPDATGVGWVFEYALIDPTGKHSLQELTTFQNWHLKYALQSVKGVSEVATIGGMTKQYQIQINPQALLTYKISLIDVIKALQSSNKSTGARLLEMSGKEYMVTVGGYIRSRADIEQIVLRSNSNGVSIRIKDIANVVMGPDIRRGVAEFNGRGEAVGGVIIMRNKENALLVIDRVKEKLKTIQLPEGVQIATTYDRSDLIKKAIHTLQKELVQQVLIVSLIIFIFLLHFPSAMIPIITLPIAVILSFIPMFFLKVTSNVMSLGGIAIAIGVMVDASIVIIENTHKRLSEWQESGSKEPKHDVLLRAVKEVGKPSFFSLLVVCVAFLPIFTLTGVEGRLFTPLAITKTMTMLFAAILAITLGPALILMFFTRIRPFTFKSKILTKLANKLLIGTIHNEKEHPLSRRLIALYEPIVRRVLEKPKKVISIAIVIFIITMPLFLFLGSEFMPPLNEGSILYMPTTPPGISIKEATRLLHAQDRILKNFPEVESVFGKSGRAETATDPAPFSMMETVIVLKPQEKWRRQTVWYSKFAPFLAPRISWDELIKQMNEALNLPGQVNAWTMPIKARIDMLSTGVRTPVGIKIYGDNLSVLEAIGSKIEDLLRPIKGTRSVFAERTAGGYFVNIEPRREDLARFGLTIEDFQMTIGSAVGGENITYTIEGRERFPVNIRYPRELRDDPEKIKNIYISTMSGAQIQIRQVADISISTGPSMIRDENGRLAGYVFIDVAGRDIGGYVKEAKSKLAKDITLPAGYSIQFSGQYEFMERVKARMMIVLPVTLLIIFFLIRINTGSLIKTGIIFLAVPFSLIGVALILFLLRYNMSIGVWAGIISLLGIDAGMAIYMLLYLDLSYDERKSKGKMKTIKDLKEAIVDGAAHRIRPKLMTVTTAFIGLMPIMLARSSDVGADVTKRIAAPMVGGLLTSFLMELLVYPAIYYLWKAKELNNKNKEVKKNE